MFTYCPLLFTFMVFIIYKNMVRPTFMTMKRRSVMNTLTCGCFQA